MGGMVDAATKTLLDYGLAGAVILLLVALLFWVVRQQRIDRQEMREAHRAERAEMQKVNAERYEAAIRQNEKADASQNRNTDVLMELKSVIGELAAVQRERRQG